MAFPHIKISQIIKSFRVERTEAQGVLKFFFRFGKLFEAEEEGEGKAYYSFEILRPDL
jgi:hypothetical protein